MYVTVRRYKIASGSTAELKRRIQQEFLPIISKVPGFVEYFWMSSGENEMFSVNVFQDRSGAEQSVKAAADYVKKNLTSLLPNPPEVISGEVVAHQATAEAERAA
jgi:antibiotic biosynthesis monooxygenase